MDTMRHWHVQDAPQDIRDAVRRYDEKYAIRLTSVFHLPSAWLRDLHSREPAGFDHSNLTVVSRYNSFVARRVAALSIVANSDEVLGADRDEYLRTMLQIYENLPPAIVNLVFSPDSLIVAPRREGHLLAKCLGWLPPGRHLAPHVKRIPYDGGLLVGIDDMPLERRFERCVIVDGAIASGASLMATISRLQSSVDRFVVLSGHSSETGALALLRFAERRDLAVSVAVGHASGILDSRFYAVEVDESGRSLYVIGDVGDMTDGARSPPRLHTPQQPEQPSLSEAL